MREGEGRGEEGRGSRRGREGGREGRRGGWGRLTSYTRLLTSTSNMKSGLSSLDREQWTNVSSRSSTSVTLGVFLVFLGSTTANNYYHTTTSCDHSRWGHVTWTWIFTWGSTGEFVRKRWEVLDERIPGE